MFELFFVTNDFRSWKENIVKNFFVTQSIMHSFEIKLYHQDTMCHETLFGKMQRLAKILKIQTETNKSSITVHPHICAIKIKYSHFRTQLMFGHIPKEMARHCCSYLHERGTVAGYLISQRISCLSFQMVV